MKIQNAEMTLPAIVTGRQPNLLTKMLAIGPVTRYLYASKINTKKENFSLVYLGDRTPRDLTF